MATRVSLRKDSGLRRTSEARRGNAGPSEGDRVRKRPVQSRSQRTVEAIFKATAQIVDKEGLAALSTNKIAETAGFSVGTLYQYFSSKEAVLQAMIDDERQRIQAEMQTMLNEVLEGTSDPQKVLRLRIRALIKALGTGDRLSRTIVRMAWQMDLTDGAMQSRQEGAQRLLLAWELIADRAALRMPTQAMSFIATRAVMGVIRSASLENSPLLGTQVFEDELVRMVWDFIRAPQAAS